MIVKMPLPALEVSRKNIPVPLLTPLTLKLLLSSAVALFMNCIVPPAATKFWVVPELFVIPTPLRVNRNVGPAVIVKALAPALNVMPFTSVLAERETAVRLLVAKLDVSDAPLGTVAGDQLLAVFQSPVAGFPF